MQRWRGKGELNDYCNEVYMDLCKQAANANLPVLDIASGPGLGLIPDIYHFNSNLQALVIDGCPMLVEKWSEFLRAYASEANIQFASLNAAGMPIHNDSIDIITSNIGFSSLRCAGADNMLGVREAYRVLKPGGYVYTIENEFEDKAVVQKVFDLWGRKNWFSENKLTWRERFEDAGFCIEQENLLLRRVEKNGWELGEAATSFGLEIAMVFKVFVLKKRFSDAPLTIGVLV